MSVSLSAGRLRPIGTPRTYAVPYLCWHIYRRTVTTLTDDAGLTARQAADQLGHAKVSMAQDNHFGRKVARTGAAGLLEVFGDGDDNPRPTRVLAAPDLR